MGKAKLGKKIKSIEADADKRFQNKLNNTEIEVELPDGSKVKRSIQAHDIHLSKKNELIEDYAEKIRKTKTQIKELDTKLTQGKKMLDLHDGNPQRQGLGYWYKEKYSLDQQQEDFTQKTKKIGRLQKVLKEAKASELSAKNAYTKARLEYVGLQSKAKKLQEAETYKKAQKRYEATQKRYAAARKQSRQAQETMRRRHHLLGWYRHQATTQQRILKHLKKAAKTLFVPGPKTGDLDVDKALWALCRTFLSLQSLPNADPVYQPAIAQEMKRELAVYLKGFFTQLANLHYTPKEKVVKSHMEGYSYTQAELQKVATDKLKTELRSALQNMQQELRVLITHQALIDQGENKK